MQTHQKVAAEVPPKLMVVDDPRFDAHRPRGYHPERVERLDAARSGLRTALPADQRLDVAPERARDADVARVHDPGYVAALHQLLARGHGYIDADTYFSPGTEEAAFLAAGGAMALARGLMRGDARRGIALLRPPGHHALADVPMGFCLLNNVALAASAALEAGAEKVAIVDWDVHHGNGTQAIFERDPRVLFVSLHQYPFYPGTGASREVGVGAGKGSTVNLPLPAGTGPDAYGEAFRRVVIPILDRFGADVVLVSSGFDAHARDPLAEMELDAPTFAAMATALVRHAERAGHGRVAVVLEGGYDLGALEASTAAVVRALQGEVTELPEGSPRAMERNAIDQTIAAVSRYWEGVGVV